MTAAARVGEAWAIEYEAGCGQMVSAQWFARLHGTRQQDWQDGVWIAMFRTRDQARKRLPEVKDKIWKKARVVRVRIGIEVTQ